MIHVRLFSTQGINIYALKKQSNVTLTNHVFLNNVPIFYTSQSISPKNSIYTIYQIKLNLNRGTKIKIKSILKLNYFHFLYSIFYTIIRCLSYLLYPSQWIDRASNFILGYINRIKYKSKNNNVCVWEISMLIGVRMRVTVIVGSSRYRSNWLHAGQAMEIKRFVVRELLPDTKYYMTYDGSITMPACHETTTWIILNKPIYITKQQVREKLSWNTCSLYTYARLRVRGLLFLFNFPAQFPI